MKKIIAVVIVLFLFQFSFSQKLKLLEGDLTELKGVDSYNVVFDYNGVKIPNYESEEDFLKDKMAKRDKKEKGLGEKFKKSWFDDRTKLYEPYFVDNFNGYFIMKRKIRVRKGSPNEKYTIKIKSTMIYPGYNVVAAWEQSKVRAIITIYETGNPEQIIAKINAKNILGKSDYNSGIRIANSYGILAKGLAKFLKKKT